MTDTFETFEAEVAAELDRWTAAGRRARFWWRDDDAVAATPQLERLFSLTSGVAAPLALAIIPAPAEDSLAQALDGVSDVTVLQHGYAHVNHAPKGSGGAWELGLHRPRETIKAELWRGRARLEELTAERFLPVIAAPWNRVDPALYEDFADAGFTGVSAGGEAAASEPVPGFRRVDVHLDPVHWKKGGGFRGWEKFADDVTERLGQLWLAGGDEVTGLVTHHLVMDEGAWAAAERLGGLVSRHPAACWVGPGELFGSGA